MEFSLDCLPQSRLMQQSTALCTAWIHCTSQSAAHHLNWEKDTGWVDLILSLEDAVRAPQKQAMKCKGEQVEQVCLFERSCLKCSKAMHFSACFQCPAPSVTDSLCPCISYVLLEREKQEITKCLELKELCIGELIQTGSDFTLLI